MTAYGGADQGTPAGPEQPEEPVEPPADTQPPTPVVSLHQRFHPLLLRSHTRSLSLHFLPP